MIRVLDSAGSTLVEWGRQQQQQQVKTVNGFTYLVGRVSAGLGCETAVTAGTSCELCLWSVECYCMETGLI